MRKLVLLLSIALFSFSTIFAQDGYWSSRADKSGITTDKAVARANYPKEFSLFSLKIEPLRQKLFSIIGRNASASSVIITLPDADGGFEKFEVFEASNFVPALQAKFPEIRAYSGRSIIHSGSTLKLSIAPNGIQTMVFRTNGKPNEYIEPYSADHTVYSVFKSQRNKGGTPWLCSTPDEQLAAGLNNKVRSTNDPLSSTGELKTMRLAQSVVAEYSNFFGATGVAQVGLVVAAVNVTMTRTNGCYEKDLALHLNLIANTTAVFYYDPATDPYSPGPVGAGGAWNGELQATLTSVIGDANYDIGHLFGASGGGGNAGCIGCVCSAGIKGRGFTSPANGIPQGDDFDIDYVAHEIGHQLGGNHTFSQSLEGTGVNKEVGSGITIMGYAGITSFDVAPHSIDIFHEASIQQIQVNLATKTCPVTTSLAGINATPVVAALTNYTIPPSTPFALTGTATDANAGDVLTYCWEQDDNSTTTGANSVASPTKLTGPNWLSFSPFTNGTRICPVLPTILAGNSVTGPLPGGDAGANIEALSSVSRVLNFRLTVRDNRSYNSGTGAVGQTNFGNMAVTVDATTYTPFLITSQNTAISYTSGSAQTVIWSVGNTTAAPVSCANVKISFSTDGGITFTTLIASTPNDGTETVTLPSATTTTGRIKVEAIGNIFFDINNAPITITLPSNAFTFNTTAAVLSGCPVPATMQGSLTASFLGTFTGPVALTAAGNPAGTTVIFGTNSLSSANATTTVTLTGTNTLPNGNYTITITGMGAGVPTQNRDIVFTINPGVSPIITTQPANVSACNGAAVSFNIAATGATIYQWQLSTNNGATWTNIAGATTTTYGFTAVTADNGKQFRCVTSNVCGAITNTNAATLSIVNLNAGALTPATATVCGNPNSTVLTLNGSAGTIVRWEVSIDNGVTWTNIANTTTTLTATNITQNSIYRVLVQSVGCLPAFSGTSNLTFVSAGVGALTISSDNGIVLCSGDPTKLTALTAPTPGMVSVSSGLISVAIPDNSAAGIGTNLTLAGVPATATGTNARVNFNITHTWDSDLRIFIKSPNNQVLNLVNGRGGSGDNFTNTVISSASANSLAAGVAPFTGTFMADGSLAALAPIGFTPTATTFTPLINTAGQLNGIWSLGARDGAAGDAGIITTWGLSLDYAVPAGAPAGATYVWTPAAGLNATTGNPVAASPAVTTTYTVVATNGSGCTGTANITITVNQRPAVTTQPSNVAVCTGTSATFTVAATGTGISYQWQESTNGGTTWTGLTNGTPYAGVTTAALTVNPVTAAMNNNRYRCVISGTCTPAANSNGAVLTVKALPNVVVTPASGCGGVAGINGLQLSTGSAAPPIPGTLTVNSGTISVAVPDNTANGASHTLNIAGIPANATIVNARVTLNMTHTWNGDMLFNLKAPNNTVLALDKYLTGTGGAGATTGFVNTVISSAGITALSAGTGTYTGTFKPDLINGTITGTTVQNPAGFVSTASSFADLYATPNGPWILAMADGGNGDVGTLTGWSITIDYTTPGGTGSPLTYTWSPAAGLYNNATATAGYILGTQTPTVYAAPTVFTTYTVTGTDATTGCSNTATALINYTPPAPTVTPNPVAMCLGDVPVKLKSSSSTSTTACFNSGTISVAIPDNTANGVSSNLTVSGVPANATIASVTVRLTMPHTWVGDMIFNLKAPNGNILSLDKYLSGTGGAGATAGFTNTVISSAGAAALSSGSSPYTGTFRADALLTVPFPFSDPAGFAANVTNWPGLYATPNGTWTLAMADGGPADLGTLTNWEICINYVVGVPSAPAVWTPAAGLFSNAAGTTAYVAGTAVDSVWASPTTIGINPYQVTVNSLPPPAVTPATNFATGNGQALVTFNIRNNNAYPVTLSSISSAFLATGSSTNTAFMKTSAINGVPGAISAANGWNQIGTSTVTVGTALSITPAVTGMSVAIPAGATYGIAIQGLAGAAGNISYSTLAAGVSTFTAGGCSIITGTGIGFGGVAAPGAPTFTPRGFIGSVSFLPGAVAACTSPARTVEVTVNQPISITAQPVNAVACTDKATSFTVAASGTTPTYQWQVSTNTGNTFTNVANGGVYTGATTATLTITAPPTTMSGYIYRCNVSGAAPCSTVASAQRLLTVNPLPTVTIAASPYRALFPGLTTTLFSTVTPAAATYTWLRNGTAVGGTGASSLLVNVDGLGTYTLRVTDVNGCVNTSNTVLLTDSASGKVFIYPNPNSGQFQVRYYSALNNTGLPRGINVYDARGKRIVTSTYSISAPYARMDVDLRNHGTGVYTIEVVDVNGNRLAVGRAEVLR